MNGESMSVVTHLIAAAIGGTVGIMAMALLVVGGGEE